MLILSNTIPAQGRQAGYPVQHDRSQREVDKDQEDAFATRARRFRWSCFIPGLTTCPPIKPPDPSMAVPPTLKGHDPGTTLGFVYQRRTIVDLLCPQVLSAEEQTLESATAELF
ncbi:hypothetical protein ColKHC_05393 [Colletotrichum higginsianum]|nr:hypothetical protein ColKHC_05393 [Colletotrichum higginsianum]